VLVIPLLRQVEASLYQLVQVHQVLVAVLRSDRLVTHLVCHLLVPWTSVLVQPPVGRLVKFRYLLVRVDLLEAQVSLQSLPVQVMLVQLVHYRLLLVPVLVQLVVAFKQHQVQVPKDIVAEWKSNLVMLVHWVQVVQSHLKRVAV
jgi:hypothetical protein